MAGTLKKIGFAFATTVLVFAVAEGAARLVKSEVARATIPAQEIQAHVDGGAMKYHPQLGWVRAELPLPSEGLNKVGFRYGKEITKENPGWRAFTLGDSQTYGAGVRWQEAYPAIAEDQLHELHGADGVQLVNAGISGYGSLQALRLTQHVLLEYDPDLIIVDTETNDDRRDDLVITNAGTTKLQEILFYSRAYYFLRVAVERAAGVDGRRMSADPEVVEGVKQTREDMKGNHDLIVELGKREGFEVLFVDYPVWAGGPNVQCRVFQSELPEGAHVAPVCAALQASGHPGHELFFDMNHMRPLGCEIAGKALAKAIEDQGLGPS